MPNFAMQIRGEPEPRGFRYDVEEDALYTDIEIENPRGGMEDQRQLKITEATAQTDPQSMMYWEQTAVFREAYRICEEEGLSFEEAFEKVSVSETNNESPFEAPPEKPPSPPPQQRYDPPDTEESSEPKPSDPIAGIVITTQQLILGALMIMVEHPEDSKEKLIEYLKTELEKINDYEIII